MRSLIIIAFFLIFIAIGLIMEHRNSDKVTPVVWLPFFWLVICASRSVNQWINIYNYDSMLSESQILEINLKGSPVDQVVLSLVIIFGLVMLYKRKNSAITLLKNNKSVLIFVIYLGLTVIWSDIYEASFRRWIKLTGNVIMAAVLVTEPYPFAAVQSVFRRATYLLIPISIMLIKYFPSIGVIYSRLGNQIVTGAALMKNGLGHLSFVFLFFISWQIICNRKGKYKTNLPMLLYDVITLIMCVWLLIAAKSSGAIGSLVVGMTILISSRIPIIAKNFMKITIASVVIMCLFLILESSVGIIEFIVTSLGRNMTFTDRVPLWNTLIEIGMKQPILGYGYGGFWTVERLKFFEDFTQGHSGYLELFVEGGLFAIILLCILLITVFRKILKGIANNFNIAILLLSFFVMILLANITESCFARERDLLTFVFFIIALYDNNQDKNSNLQISC